MKKNYVYALMSAIALAGAVSFSACSSSDEIIDNPDYNPEANSVKTQFSISLPWDKNNSKTRQAGDVVQVANEYGMEDAARVTEFIWSQSSSELKNYPTFKALDYEESEGS